MSRQLRLGFAYGILVILLVTLGTWWVFYLGRESANYEREQLNRLHVDLRQAEHLIRTVPGIAADPAARIGEIYPHLQFVREGQRITVSLHPMVVSSIQDESRRKQRMFQYEGAVFLILLVAGVAILIVSYRSERRYRLARELFVIGATHELKTPLASLRLYTETLGRDGLSPDARDGIRGHMLEDVDRLQTMVEQLLALTREERWRATGGAVFDLGSHVREVLEEMEGFFKSHGSRVEAQLPDGHLVRGERSVLALVVQNVLSNAVLHAAGPVRIVLRLSRQAEWLRLAVRDDGPGIPRADQRRIFWEFVRGSGSGPAASVATGGRARPRGAGLGLFLVKRQMELLGGRVELRSRVGEGSTFTLVLPAHREENA